MERKKKILVVDDEIEFLNMIKLRLEASGYDVVTATNGKEVFDRIREHKPDAILLDILLPGMNGLEVLKRIRNENKQIPVFIITAFSSQERFELANKFNASGFIVKTQDIKTEIDNITSILRVSDKYKG
ncbi:MAG: response regulator [Candidatus Omnitrophica bacterium]|nr:response regulator [Candidatus Omnitrophota bacterium]